MGQLECSAASAIHVGSGRGARRTAASPASAGGPGGHWCATRGTGGGGSHGGKSRKSGRNRALESAPVNNRCCSSRHLRGNDARGCRTTARLCGETWEVQRGHHTLPELGGTKPTSPTTAAAPPGGARTRVFREPSRDNGRAVETRADGEERKKKQQHGTDFASGSFACLMRV